MTVRVTTLKGCDAGAYYVEQLPNYYLQSGEPRGTWLGDGAPMLGLSGEVDDDAFLALIAGHGPAAPGPASRTPLQRRLGPRLRRHRLGTQVGVGPVRARRRRHPTRGARRPRRRGHCARRMDRTSRPHPLPDRRRGRRRRRRGDRRGDVPAAHQPSARPAAPHPPRDRQPGEVARRSLARSRRPPHQGRPAHPVGALPRRSAIRADATSRCGVAHAGERHRRDPRRARGAPRRVLDPHRPDASTCRGEARPLRRHDGPRTDTTGALADRPGSRRRQPPPQGEVGRRREPPRRLARAGQSARAWNRVG